jgi:uncharacterized protein (TIGR02598 family)
MKLMKRCLKAGTAAGFSLVEVTLAVAIAALALITLLGLLPQGLEMSRKTSLITNYSNIVEQIARDLDNARFTMLPTSQQRKYFNDQGTELQADSEEIVFVAEIDPRQPATLPRSEATQLYLRRFIIKVTNSGNRDFEFGENNRMSYSTFNHLVAQTR